MSDHVEYLELVPNEQATHLKVRLYYSLGGMNMFTYKQEPRGYYLSVTPVKREKRDYCTMESFAAFTGTKQLVLPVSRQSAKRMEQARKEAESMRAPLIDYVLADQGLTLAS